MSEKPPPPEEMAEQFERHCQRSYGMGRDAFLALPFEVQIALMQKAGSEFASIGPGGLVSGEAKPPQTEH